MPRTRYRWNETTHCLEEVGADWAPTNGSRQPVFTDRYMEGISAPDGTDIGTRGKRKEYMRRNNVTDFSDFSDSYREGVRKEQERTQKREIQETVDRIIHSKI